VVSKKVCPATINNRKQLLLLLRLSSPPRRPRSLRKKRNR